ncbi:MAG: DUF58 domain-containing protein [Frankiaceae bacterium]
MRTPHETETLLRRLELSVTRRLDGLLLGAHLGLLPGLGSEKAESREYRAGDDVRRMDWAVTARTTVPHVHDLIADRELETWVLADLSASMEFGTATGEKRDLVLAATAAVGFLTARPGNRIGALLLAGGGRAAGTAGTAGTVVHVPARPGRDAVRTLLRHIAATPRAAVDAPATGRSPGPPLEHPLPASVTGAVTLATGLEQLRRPPRRRGLVAVVSDFLGTPPEEWERPLRALSGRHEVLAIEVLDPRELELPDVGLLRLVDPETGRLLDVATRSRKLRSRYAAAAAEQRSVIAATLRRAHAHHLQLRTDRDWLLDVVRYAAEARRRRGVGG